MSRKGTLSAKSQKALGWLGVYVSEYADTLPDSPKLHLPPCLTRGSVYDHMKDEMENRGDIDIVSKSHFYFLWRMQRPDVVIPKVLYIYVW